VNHQFIQGDEKSRCTYHIGETKTDAGTRKVPISDDLYELLKELKAETYFEAYKFKAEVDGYSGFVIHTRTGLPILTARLNEYAKKVVAEYNGTHKDKLPNVTCHTCRHTFCSRLAEMKISPHALQKIVGHGSYETTARVYISVEDDFVNEEFFRVMRGAV
jgi:integrase